MRERITTKVLLLMFKCLYINTSFCPDWSYVDQFVILKVFAAMLRHEIRWFDQEENSSGSLSSVLASDATLVRSALADRLSTMVQNLSLILAAFAISFILNWQLAVVVISTLPLIVSASIAEVST